MTAGRTAILVALLLGSCQALAQDGPISRAPVQSMYEPSDSEAPLAAGVSASSGGGGGGASGTSQGNAAAYAGYVVGLPGSTASASVQSDTFASVFGGRLVESTWYTREEYFHWNERFDGADFVNEYGLLFTLGYQRRVGPERYRAELFGGTMHYVGGAQFDDGTTEPLISKTGYLGVRGEYDFLIEPDWLPKASLLLGVGTRFWFRDLRDGMTDSGTPVIGYQEMWWTFYPYLGVETRRILDSGPEFFVSSRIGCTALTYEHATFFDAVLYPKTDLTGQVEAGVRGKHFFCSAISEVFTWRQSAIARGALQPASTLFTVGLKAGVSF
jgi:hypothetical protein